MRTLNFLALALLIPSFLLACGGSDPQVETAESAVVEAERVLEIERFWQLNSTEVGIPAEERLHCRYTVYAADEEGVMRRAHIEVKTSGKCDWPSLKHDVGEPAATVPPENVSALLSIVEGMELPQSGEPAWDCATLHVTTSARTFYLKDCDLRDRADVRTSKGYADPLAGTASSSLEEAAFRFNQALILE